MCSWMRCSTQAVSLCWHSHCCCGHTKPIIVQSALLAAHSHAQPAVLFGGGPHGVLDRSAHGAGSALLEGHRAIQRQLVRAQCDVLCYLGCVRLRVSVCFCQKRFFFMSADVGMASSSQTAYTKMLLVNPAACAHDKLICGALRCERRICQTLQSALRAESARATPSPCQTRPSHL